VKYRKKVLVPTITFDFCCFVESCVIISLQSYDQNMNQESKKRYLENKDKLKIFFNYIREKNNELK
jgi:hypothetical protein